jgi:hypothetical protein
MMLASSTNAVLDPGLALGQDERKFSQYRDGVGPRCPWYFDLTPRDP